MKPDPTWVTDPKTPIRNGETLGAYYWWSFDLYFMHCRNAIQREAARAYFDMEGDNQTVVECLEEFSREQLESGKAPSRVENTRQSE